jgi:hypothetical protein
MILASMAAMKASGDPEITHRSKRIIEALTPKKRLPSPPPPMNGHARLRGF